MTKVTDKERQAAKAAEHLAAALADAGAADRFFMQYRGLAEHIYEHGVATMKGPSNTPTGPATPRLPEASQLQDLVVAAQGAFDALGQTVVHPDDAPRDGYKLFVAANLFNSEFFASLPGFLDELAGLHGLLPGASGSEERGYIHGPAHFPGPLELSNLAATALDALVALEEAVPSPYYYADYDVPEPEGYDAVLRRAVGLRIWNEPAMKVKHSLRCLLGLLPAPTVEPAHVVHPVKSWQPKPSIDDEIPF